MNGLVQLSRAGLQIRARTMLCFQLCAETIDQFGDLLGRDLFRRGIDQDLCNGGDSFGEFEIGFGRGGRGGMGEEADGVVGDDGVEGREDGADFGLHFCWKGPFQMCVCEWLVSVRFERARGWRSESSG